MSTSADIKVRGLAALERALLALPDKLQRNVMRSALRAGAQVIRRQAQALVPVAPPTRRNAEAYGLKAGALRASIRVSARLRNGRAVAYVKAGGQRKGDPFYARFVEYGTKPHLIAATGNPGKRASVATLNRRIAKGALKIGDKLLGATVQHPGATPRPFMRPALARAARPAVVAVGQQIRARLTKAGIEAPDFDGGLSD